MCYIYVTTPFYLLYSRWFAINCSFPFIFGIDMPPYCKQPLSSSLLCYKKNQSKSAWENKNLNTAYKNNKMENTHTHLQIKSLPCAWVQACVHLSVCAFWWEGGWNVKWIHCEPGQFSVSRPGLQIPTPCTAPMPCPCSILQLSKDRGWEVGQTWLTSTRGEWLLHHPPRSTSVTPGDPSPLNIMVGPPLKWMSTIWWTQHKRRKAWKWKREISNCKCPFVHRVSSGPHNYGGAYGLPLTVHHQIVHLNPPLHTINPFKTRI